MKAKWLPITIVLAALVVIGVAKTRRTSLPSGVGQVSPGVQLLLAATPEEAASPTRCGEIVHLVRTAAGRGLRVRELNPDTDSDLLGRYHVFQTPTVLILGADGTVRSRYEGESRETLAALRSELAGLR